MTIHRHEPRWPALVAIFSVGVLFWAMPESLTVGPAWLMIAVVAVLMIPTAIFHRLCRNELNEIFAYSALSVITVGMISSLVLLIMRLPAHKDPPVELLRAARRSGSAISCSSPRGTGGWMAADRMSGIRPSPQGWGVPVSADVDGSGFETAMGEDKWSPGFVDYLFLAFFTSTAFSPTDVPVLSSWAKAMMIVQSLISLATVALLAARAVNILEIQTAPSAALIDCTLKPGSFQTGRDPFLKLTKRSCIAEQSLMSATSQRRFKRSAT